MVVTRLKKSFVFWSDLAGSFYNIDHRAVNFAVMAQQYTVQVVDESHIGPPPGSVPPTVIPLTFLDVSWLFCCPIERILFYELPFPTRHLMQNIIPHLKHSLSLTLHHFFPLAGNLACNSKPFIQFNEGDSVRVTVAESDADFGHLVANHLRDNRAFKPLVPKLPFPFPSVSSDNKIPVMAIQVTVFPNSGISIGVTSIHVAADGSSFNHFMKSWASIHKSVTVSESLPPLSLPCHDRNVIKDPNGLLLSIYLKDWRSVHNSDAPAPAIDENVQVDNVRVTLVLSRDQIDKLKQRVSAQIRSDDESPSRVSTFVVTSALMWVYMIELQESESEITDGDMIYHFVPVADCRERFEFPIPASYFGNCLAFLFISAKRSELMGKEGVVFAAKAIGRKIGELEKAALVGAEKWTSNLNEAVKTGRVLAVGGSPKFGVYETDFGWGRPKKFEFVHFGAYGSFSLAESRDEEGAIEIGLVIGRDKLDLFNVVFQRRLNFNCL